MAVLLTAGASSEPHSIATENPHDAYAKYVFRKPSRAAETVSAVVGPALARLIDWRTLKLEPTELADDSLHHFFPDLRFSARLRGQEIRIDLVFEHQSEVDRLMAVRLLCEMGAIWAGLRQDGRSKVPFVLSVVLYNGLAPWPAERELWAAIEGGDQIRASAPHLLPAMPFLVEDLATLTDAAIEARVQSDEVKLALLLLKHARRGEGVGTLHAARRLAARAAPDVLRESVRYVLQVDRKATEQDVGREIVTAVGKRKAAKIMTVGERLIEQGWREGLAKGLAKGKAEGKAEGKIEAKAEYLELMMLGRGFVLTDKQRLRIAQCRDAAQLDRWAKATLKARTVNEVFRPVTRH